MHDPMTVAWNVPGPWLRKGWPLRSDRTVRWGIVRWLRSNTGEQGDYGQPVYPWYRPAGWHGYLAGQRYRLGDLATIWHVEPKNHDSGEICRHWRTRNGENVVDSSWRWHVHHWRIQLPWLQELRRWALTRCEWCGGRSRKGHRVDLSHGWDRPRSPWWRGARGLYHHDCSSVENAHRACTCDEPRPKHEGYGECRQCQRFLAWRSHRDPREVEALRVMQQVPPRQRPDEARLEYVRGLWRDIRADERAAGV